MKKINNTVENLNLNIIDARDFGSRIKSGRQFHTFSSLDRIGEILLELVKTLLNS